MAGRVVVHRPALQALIASPNGGVARDLAARARRVVNRSKALVRVNTGRLRASITYEVIVVGGVLVARIGTNVSYALFEHDGTGIYGPLHRPIVPRTAKVLAWKGRGGTWVFARSVKGAPGTKFLLRALPAAAG